MAESTEAVKRTRADGQLSALAGEFFVAAELLKGELQTSVTFGNAKAIDLLAYNPKINCTFKVQVKTLRKPNYFPLRQSAVKLDHVYVFVLLNRPSEAVRYFVIPGGVLRAMSETFGKDFQHPTFPGIHPKHLKDFEGAWYYFDSAL